MTTSTYADLEKRYDTWASRQLTNRELDALVAVKVLGWKHANVPEHNIPELRWQWLPPNEHPEWRHSLPQLDPPRLSTSIELAWLVVEEMRKRQRWLDLFVSVETVTAKFVGDGNVKLCTCDTAPEAICRAALEAIKDD